VEIPFLPIINNFSLTNLLDALLHSTLVLPNKNPASAATTHDSSGDYGNDRKNALHNLQLIVYTPILFWKQLLLYSKHSSKSNDFVPLIIWFIKHFEVQKKLV
jgi:hypothetical protein